MRLGLRCFVLALSGLCVSVLGASVAPAQIASAPPDGLYEELPSITLEPVGSLAVAPTDGSSWVAVSTRAGATTATFMPDRRVAWRITWGPHGPLQKITSIDGEEWTRSRFTYDSLGHLATKVVTGPGAPTPLTYAYRTDASGRILERTVTVPRPSRAPLVERVTLSRSASELVVVTEHDGAEVRRDVRELGGALRETRFSHRGAEVARLTYVRLAGRLVRIERRLGTRVAVADATQPDPSLVQVDMVAVSALALDRREAWLLLGAPIHSTDEGRGIRREVSDDWAQECWMNATSGLQFDPTGLARETSQGCICGFCVDATLALDDAEAASALGTDLHWTRGPWIRLDDRVDVTADHRVMTPEGPVLAGALSAGDVVLASDGSPHVLRSVEHLVSGALRLGRNLRTEDGTFAAGGLLFESEEPRACERE